MRFWSTKRVFPREIGRLAWNGFEVADLEPDRVNSFQKQIEELVDEACPANE